MPSESDAPSMMVSLEERDHTEHRPRLRVMIALAAVAATLLVAWTVYVPFYDTNDDTFMRLMAEGRAIPGAPPEPRLLFMNALIGVTVVALNRALAGWPWYDLVIGAIQVLSAVAMIAVLLRRRSLPDLVALAGFVAIFWITSFVRLQFSVVAGQAAAAGCLLIGEMLVAGDLSRRFLSTRGTAAVVLIVLGALVRWQAAVLVLALAGALALPLLAAARSRTARRAALVPALTVVVVAGLLIGAVNVIDRQIWAAAAGWADFRAAHGLRALLTEWLPRTADMDAQLVAARAAAGWSENDLTMLGTRFHSNLDIFGRQRLEPAVRAAQDAARTTTVLGHPRDELPRAITGTLQSIWTQSSYAIAFVVLAGVAWLRRSVLRYAIYSVVVLLATAVFTSLLFKEIPYRVLWPMLTLSAACVLMSAAEDTTRGRPVAAAILIAIVSVVCAGGTLLALGARSALFHARALEVQADVTALTGQPRRTYVIPGSAFTYQGYFRPLAPSPPPEAFTFLPLAATSQTPLVQDYLRREGIRDVALSLCTEDRFRLISDRDLPVIETYVAEHFGQSVRIEAEFKGQTFATYRCGRRPEPPALAEPKR